MLSSARKETPRTYIVPTRFGFYFAFLCLVLFVTAFAYGNNFLYFFVFWMVSIGITGLFLTNSIVSRSRLVDLRAESFFAGETGELRVTVLNVSNWKLWDLRIQPDRERSKELVVDVIARGAERRIAVKLNAARRGRMKWPDLRIETNFPFGFALAWKTILSQRDVIVWPVRRGHDLDEFLRQTRGDQGEKLRGSPPQKLSDGNLPEQFRPFQDHDNAGAINWKLYARFEKLFVAESDRDAEMHLMFDDDLMSEMDREDRISQLARWIWEAEASGFYYGVKFEGKWFPLSTGNHHLREILDHLGGA